MQNCSDWTAGPISKKVRGVNIKNRAWIEILSSKLGLRVDSVKARGLLCKSGSADHFSLSLTRVGNKSRPLDLHRAVQGEGARGRRRGAPETRARGRASPALSNPALQGLIRAGFGRGAPPWHV